MKKLNGVHGMIVGTGFSMVVLGGAFLCATLFPMAKASPEPAFTAVKIGETSNSDMERFYDREAGVVCYIIDGYRAMDCVPVKDTNIEWRTSP